MKKRAKPRPRPAALSGARRTSDASPAAAAPESPAPVETPTGAFPIVGIGASAGGLAAFEAFFSGMPAGIEPGMAFVLVQHLAPHHKSLLSELIQRCTRMRVFEVEDGMKVRPNCAYIIPPGRDMAFLNGSLQLLDPVTPHGQRLPIDFFFRSLALDQAERAIGIVLSGTGSDGTIGIRAIKGEGGMVMVQTPESAEHDGMPQSALATGLVDYALPPAEMAAQLIAYRLHAFGKRSRPAAPAAQENAMRKIFVLLRARTGHDFSQYKPSTSKRRIERRMAVHQIDTMDGYVTLLQRAPEEVDALFRDMLIGVTSFFRDPAAFRALEERVLPRLFAGRRAGSTLRIWVPGCSTGEEAYSLAILFAEHLETLKQGFRVLIFSTDIDRHAIAFARAGLYPASIASDLTPERLSRFFAAEPGEGSFRIRKTIRDMLVFSEQSVIKDPPFSKLDLISCRNLLIYLGADLQKKLIALFHYALNPGGFLFLGTSETAGESEDRFVALDRKLKLYQRQPQPFDAPPAEPGLIAANMTTHETSFPNPGDGTVGARKAPLRELTEQALLQQLVPVGALVNAQGQILYLHGRSGNYLEPSPGEGGPNNILKMAREGLRRELTAALRKAVGSKETVQVTGVRVRTNGHVTPVNLTVRPVPTGLLGAPDQILYLVILEKAPEPAPAPADGRRSKTSPEKETPDTNSRIAALKRELRAKEEYLRTTNEELETSNEELKSANEELQSMNEELQSANEELETSKEELQSVNEELSTVNAEMQTKVSDLARANNDMSNLLAGTGIATVFVDHDLRILRFTPAATKIIHLIQGDIGRPVSHLVSKIPGYGNLAEDTQAVLDTLVAKEADVQTADGRWYAMRIQPYRTLDNVIKGAVLTFVDVTATRAVHAQLRLNEERLRVALGAAPVALANQDTALRYTWSHNPFLGIPPDQLIGRTDADVLAAAEAAALTTIKRQVIETGQRVHREIASVIGGQSRVHQLTVEPLRDLAGQVVGITCAAVDVTGTPPRAAPDAPADENHPSSNGRR